MQYGYYQVTGAMVAQFNKLDVTTNNLANVNSSGFKRDKVIIGDFERLYQEKRDILPLKNNTKESAKFFNRTINRVPRVVEIHTDFSPANIKHTGNPLDLALNGGDLFFAVKTPNGIRLTQQSSFILNSEGALTTKDGYRLLPSDFQNGSNKDIKLQQGKNIVIGKDGTIFVDGKKNSKIFITRVNNLKELQKEGDNLFKLKNISNRIKELNSSHLVKQGYKNLSNVNAVKEMVNLIEINRLVEMYQKVMTTQMDELNKDAITKLASIRA